MKQYLISFLRKASNAVITGIFFVVGVGIALFFVYAFQSPSGLDTNPSTSGFTSTNSWVATTLNSILGTSFNVSNDSLHAIRTKIDTLPTSSSTAYIIVSVPIMSVDSTCSLYGKQCPSGWSLLSGSEFQAQGGYSSYRIYSCNWVCYK